MPKPPQSKTDNHSGRQSWDDTQTLLSEVSGLIRSGMTPSEAAELVGVDIQDKKLPKAAVSVPTPEQIKKAARNIRLGWSPGEKQRRNVGVKPPGWEVPFVSTENVALD